MESPAERIRLSDGSTVEFLAISGIPFFFAIVPA
jgi:hypothetical protein